MDKTILHVDANSFYASVECAKDPDLKGKPVAVVGDASKRHGIILAANYVAKNNYGVTTAETIWQAQKKCPELVLKDSNMKLYMEYSRKLRDILLSYSDYVEPFGCDEAWVELRGFLAGKGAEIAENIRARVKTELGITVSVGVSFNKVFAKLGSDIKKPDAVTLITRDNYKDKVWGLPVENLLYVGKRTKNILNRRAVYTIGDLAKTDRSLICTWLGKNGEMIHDYANGGGADSVERYESLADEKSISSGTTCHRDMITRNDVKTVIAFLSEDICARMRRKGIKGREVTIRVRNSDLKWSSHSSTLDIPTNITREITDYATKLFDEVYNTDAPIRSLSVSVGSFCDGFAGMQIDLLGNDQKRKKLEKLDRINDVLKDKFGADTVFKANKLVSDILK